MLSFKSSKTFKGYVFHSLGKAGVDKLKLSIMCTTTRDFKVGVFIVVNALGEFIKLSLAVHYILVHFNVDLLTDSTFKRLTIARKQI